MESLLTDLLAQAQTLGMLGAALSFAWGGISYYMDASKGKTQIKATLIGLVFVVGAELIKNSIVSSIGG